ncbi:VOC family protein [Knoellia subterranea]|uniref:Putative pterin-4-alpha-carbinolamine dehydratase n=1 Tax=Knoellia subterranea KCTC 19937 TaxID=1385521 RepID=A0A0A0JND8_9MICO|nr:VOC family protein [Knoellia subterranea]KGN38284.1 transcriptional coactivator/pterin dehydratase [Knoellia subterranea KCTC 19937]
MDMLRGEAIGKAGLVEWRKLAQGLHARYVVGDFGAAARFVAAIGATGDEVGHHPRVVVGSGHVDLELVTADAIYRDDEGTEYVVEWVTQQDIDLAGRITEIAAEQGLTADPAAVSELELGLDVGSSAAVAPVWAALLTGDAESQGRGTPGDEVRDATVRVPNLWFDEGDEVAIEDAASDAGAPTGERFHVEVYVAPEARDSRIAAVVAAGGTVVDDSQAPGLTVIADQEGNRGVLCVDTSAIPTTD